MITKIDDYISVKDMKKYNLNYDDVKRHNEKYIKESLIKYKDYFDFIFLDGPKAQYSLLLENLIYLLKPNGTLVVDNVLFRGYTTNEQVAPTKRFKTIIKRLNDFIDMCKNHKELYDVKLIDTEDGILYAKKISK